MKNGELEINNGLPTGWAYAGLEDISDVDRHSIKRGPFGSALKKEFFVPDGYKVYEQGNVINNDFNRGTYFINDEKFEDLKSFSIKPKDILMSCAGTVGKLAIVPNGVQEGVINQALLKLSVHPDIDLQYFFKLFTYQIDEILKSNLRGSAMMNLTSVKDLKLVKFPIAPLNEQKRIVAKIEKLFSNLDNSDKYLLHLEKQLKRYRQSVLKSAFEGELTKEWRNINKFSYDDWKNQTILEIADKTFAGGDKPDKVSDTKTEEYPYPIYSNGLQDKGLYGYTNIYKVEEECITISARGTIGFPLVRNERFVPIVRLIVVIPKDYIFSKYLKYYLESKIVVQSGSSIPQLTVPMVKQIEILVPQLEEQQEIVNQIEKHFSIIDKLENVVQKSINESKRLRQSILKQAFEAKLVEQDPNDESASILLEKIAKAKEEYLKAQKKQVRKK